MSNIKNISSYIKLLSQLKTIRESYDDASKSNNYVMWRDYYNEHLQHLYSIFSNYFNHVIYDDFTLLMYESTTPIYDFKSKGYKRFRL